MPLDAKIVRFFTDSPRASVLEASRVLKVARATVQSRLDRMQDQRRDRFLGAAAGSGPLRLSRWSRSVP